MLRDDRFEWYGLGWRALGRLGGVNPAPTMRVEAVRWRKIAVRCGCKPLEMRQLILLAGDGNLVWSSFCQLSERSD